MSYTEGQIVTVTLENVEIREAGSWNGYIRGTMLGVAPSNRIYSKPDEIFFDLEEEGIKVSSAVTLGTAVTNFKPKAGDVYRADGHLWTVRRNRYNYDILIVENGLGDSYSNDPMNSVNEYEQFAAMKPVLVTRDGYTV
jgi:hypothetical protein